MSESSVLKFGRFELLPERRCLLRDGEAMPLGARAFDVLLALVERRDRLVTKNELLDVVWPDLVVEENNLQVQISSLRKLLGPQAIATVPGRGYRFAAALEGTADTQSRSAGPSDRMPVAAPQAQASESAHPLTNLPGELPPLFGRDEDLAALRSLIETHKLVTIVGAGGIGKSRLAQAAAHVLAGGWPDGVWMVELAGLSDPLLLPNAIAQALRLKMPGKEHALEELVAGLAQRTLLLVLDNCEHLLAAAADVAQALAQGAPNVRLLATSQEPLHLPAEQQYRVLPLAVPSETTGAARGFGAVALLEARVRSVDPRFALNAENLALAIDICRRLDGLPLAIELAAARVPTLGLRAVRDRLDERFRLLTGGARTTLRRHQTLRAALEWSHNLLNDGEKTVFRRLGAFAGGFTMELAQAVASDAQLDDWAVLDQLSALVDKSLVVVDAGDSPRYRLLESARAFALELLAAGETAEILKRHALAMRDLLMRVDGANMDGELRTDQFAALLLPELDNLRAAHAWACGESGDVNVAIALAAHAGSLIDYTVECADWLIALRQQVEEEAVDDALAARYWRALAAGNMAGRVPVSSQAEAAERARTLYERLGQPRRVFSSLLRLSQSRSALGDDKGSRDALEAARRLIRPDWPAEFHILLLRREGSLARDGGRFEEARALFHETVRVSAATGDWRLEVIARTNLADLLWEIGPSAEAARVAMELAEELRRRPAADGDMDVLFINLLGILSETGRIDEASGAAREALTLLRRTGRCYVEEWTHFFWRLRQIDAAAVLLGATDAKCARTGAALQPNEARLIAQARAALQGALPPDVFASRCAAGATLTERELLEMIADTFNRSHGSGSRWG